MDVKALGIAQVVFPLNDMRGAQKCWIFNPG